MLFSENAAWFLSTIERFVFYNSGKDNGRSLPVNIICIDSDSAALRQLTRQTRSLMPNAVVHGCEEPDEVTCLAANEGCDVLLVNTDLGTKHTDGFMLAEKIQKIIPCVNIIFITGRAEEKYAVEAYRLHASGYLKKPFQTEQLQKEFANLRYKTV
ncbi:MAG: response regulator [Oscillospiraceae bacterium]|nr:response regulator [Oscillospiraceae bacterium]